MKPRAFLLFATAGITVLEMTAPAVHALEPPPSGVIKANNALNLDQGASWVNGAVPQSGEVAVWDATVTTANTTALGLDPTWGGIRVTNPGGLVTINGGSIALGGGIDMATATTNLVLNTAVHLDTWQEWNIGTGRTVTVSTGIYGDGQVLTKTGSGIVRVNEGGRFQSLNILGGSLAISSGAISAPGGVTLGAAGASNPTLSLSQPQSVPPLVVADGTSGATLELGHGSGLMNLSSVTLASPLTVRRSLPTTLSNVIRADEPIVGGTTAGTDALILSAVNPISPTTWAGNTAIPNSFTGNVRFTAGLWTLVADADQMIPDASLVTLNTPAQVTWAMSETIDGLAGTGRLRGTGSALTIRADNLANEGARVFSGSLTQSGTIPFLTFSGNGTQVLAGGGITYGGATTITSGTLVLRDATAFGSTHVAVSGGTLELQSTAGTWTFAKPLTGAGELVISGAGTVALTGTAAHTGRTTIHGGTLELGATGNLPGTQEIAINGGNFNVSAVATGYPAVGLSGSGGVTGSVSVTSRLGLGKRLDVMNLQNLALMASATAHFGIASGGTEAALANVSGQLQINGSTLELAQLGTFTQDQKFTLFAYAMGNLSGTFAGLDDQAEFSTAGGSWRINYSDPTAGLNGGTGNRFITVTAIPEPGTAAMVGLSALVLHRRRRTQSRRLHPVRS